ncbi:hypothetical protein AX769_21210 (plasmid) [Frondihabitans sp. PAMC 28766]|uniref:cytochrome c biogenesis CcdA family protein n=1 Tax=Frondihabitans sp. PAMC 28766 TaxID=1795630 RepID=UPI00078BEA49|nr:cytochrome c biogenesis CcdA family protein [Frondihabitans sp. PAMC 28766]AMM22656.1 hypothetical protein AX769_21210 [Frondihabitans sp. PAMC 28766]
MIGYAFTLGLLAAVNPCGFPLLPAYLASFVARGEDATRVTRVARGLIAGGCVTAGFLLVFVLAGVAVGLGGTLALAWTPWVMVAVGVAIAVFGVATLIGRAPTFTLPTPGMRPGHGATTMIMYGITYAIGSLSCSLPLFLASVTERFTHLGGWAGVGTVLAYGLGMGFFVTGTGIVASLAGTNAARRIRPLARIVPVVGGTVLVASGLYLALYWTFDVLAPETTVGIVAIGSTVQQAVSTWLSTHSLRVGITAGVIVLTSFVFVAITEARRAHTPPAATPERTPIGHD